MENPGPLALSVARPLLKGCWICGPYREMRGARGIGGFPYR